MKRVLSALLVIAALVSTAACAATPVQSKLSGAPEDILNKLLEDLAATGVQMPMSLPPMAVTADISQNTLGISEADFNKYVTAASNSTAAIGTFAHQIAVIEAKDTDSAAAIKKLIAHTPDNPDDGGYNPMKWICVWPEQCLVVESGNYVLLMACAKSVAEAGVTAFQAAAGEIGEVNTFFEKAG